MLIHLKCAFKGELRRMHFAANTTFAAFVDMIHREYAVPVVIAYQAGPSTVCSITSEADYATFVQHCLRISPVDSTAKPMPVRVIVTEASSDNIVAIPTPAVPTPRGLGGKNMLNLKVNLHDDDNDDSDATISQATNANHQRARAPSVNMSDGQPAAAMHNYTGGISELDLTMLDKLGNGTFGVVRRARRNRDGFVMAVKTMPVDVQPESQKQILTELEVLHQCQSPYIVGFYGAFFSRDVIHICTELMDCGSLDSVARVVRTIPEPILSYISSAVLNGLVYLYQHARVIHRDIKPSNILLNSRGHVRLCDFGVSTKLTNSLAKTYVGTNAYMAPEKIQGNEYTVRSDVWSLGVTLVEIATGRFPYPPGGSGQEPSSVAFMGPFELLSVIVNSPSPSLPEASFSAPCRDFVQHCVIKDSRRRPGPGDLLGHPFVQAPLIAPMDVVAAWAQQYLVLKSHDLSLQ